jgi:hypothetical protein
MAEVNVAVMTYESDRIDQTDSVTDEGHAGSCNLSSISSPGLQPGYHLRRRTQLPLERSNEELPCHYGQ